MSVCVCYCTALGAVEAALRPASSWRRCARQQRTPSTPLGAVRQRHEHRQPAYPRTYRRGLRTAQPEEPLQGTTSVHLSGGCAVEHLLLVRLRD